MHHSDFLARRDTQETLKAAIVELMDKYRLDVLVHPFKSVPPEPHMTRGVEKDNPLSSVTGLPAVLVPAGYTKKENGPISIEFLGRPFSEPTLFKLAYAYEQASKVRKEPPTTPALPGEKFEYPAAGDNT
jgi:Asp-tRNA(Asn)/Glu-tRNA(Gln) amidotransferase A subunit family amidase